MNWDMNRLGSVFRGRASGYSARSTGRRTDEFLRQLGNVPVIAGVVWRTAVVAVRMILLFRRHGERWSVRKRGRILWASASRVWARWIMERIEVTVHAKGLDDVDWSRAYVVASNHQSTLDVVALVDLIPAARFVAKKEVRYIPLVGRACRLGGQVIIDRSDHVQSMAAVRKALVDWPDGTIVFFSEGTRVEGERLGVFKKGAFAIARETGLSILPVAIAGARRVLPRGSLLKIEHGGSIGVTFGQPISPEGRTVPELCDYTRSVIGDMLDADPLETGPVGAYTDPSHSDGD